MNPTPQTPILSRDFLIPFNDITAEHVEPGFRSSTRNSPELNLDALTP